MTSSMSAAKKQESLTYGTIAFVKPPHSNLIPSCVSVTALFFFTITVFMHFTVLSSKHHHMAGERAPNFSLHPIHGTRILVFEYLKYFRFLNEQVTGLGH